MLVAALGAFVSATFPVTAILAQADMAAGFSAPADDASWLVTLYNIGQLFGLPITFVLAGMLGRRRAMLLVAGGFSAASLAVALAPTLAWGLAARTLQGFFGGMLPVLMFIVLFSTLPPGPGRTRGLAGFALATSVGAGLAAWIGGVLLALGGWQMLFHAQAALGLLYLLMAAPLFRADPLNPAAARATDWTGYLLLSGGLGCLVLALAEGERRFWFETWWIGASLLAGAVLTGTALRHLWLADAPLLRFSLFRKPFTLAIALQLLFRIGTLLAVWIAPQYLMRIAGFRIEQIALALLPLSLGTAAGVGLAFWLAPRLDQRIVLSSSLALMAAAALACAGLGPDWGVAQFWPPMLLAGLGQGLFSLSTLHFAILRMERSEGATCGIVFNYGRVFGQMGGLAWFGHLVNEREKFHSARLGEPLHLLDPQTLQALQQSAGSIGTWLSDPAAAQAAASAGLAQRIARQAYAMAYGDTFLMAAAVAALALVLAWAMPAYRSPRA